MKVWQIATILLIIAIIYLIVKRYMGCSCSGTCGCEASCKCRGSCRCNGVSIDSGSADGDTDVDTDADEGFTDADVQRTDVYDACNASATRQGSYVTNICSAYRNMVKPILDSLTDDVITYNKIAKAYSDIFVNGIIPRVGQSYTQKYEDLLNAFIGFEQTAFRILSSADKSIPDGYAFIIPDPIAVTDYAPGIATWEAAATQPKSYKCVAYTSTELDSLSRLASRANRGTGGAAAQQLYSKAQAAICSSKGYYYNDGTFASKGCTDCEGCCAPSSEELAGTSGSIACPKPEVRPFRIPPRQIRLRIVPPKLKQELECYANYTRDVHNIQKSEKFISMQLGR
jgi:hypothetical protein